MLRLGILLVLQDVEKLNSNELGTKEVLSKYTESTVCLLSTTVLLLGGPSSSGVCKLRPAGRIRHVWEF